MDGFIEIKGARIHNLKNIDIRIPKNKLTVITGVSGSGKSSLAFDILYEEGKRRYLLFSGTQFMVDSIPRFDSINGLSPTVAVEQRIIRQSNPNSTVGTRTKIESMLAVLYATYGNRDPAYDDGMPLTMEMFQKNSPKGMCVKCLGRGIVNSIDEERLFCDHSIPIRDLVYHVAHHGKTRRMLDGFCAFHGISPHQQLNTLTEQQLLHIKYGDGGRTSFPGYIPWIMEICRGMKGRLRYLLMRDNYLVTAACPKCGGTGLGEQAMHTALGGMGITELESMYIKDLAAFLNDMKDGTPGGKLVGEIISKLECMVDVGLHHLALSRKVPTLSGGEIQRLFLASFIITEMDSIIFVLDEPTIGLHEVEKIKLIEIVKKLVKRGNTVVAVEHDENFMRASDHLVDLGPDAGINGGRRIFQGCMKDFMSCRDSRTAPYLAREMTLTAKSKYKQADRDKMLIIENASLHNLKNITVSIPLGLMVGIAGVSGSGKSSLVSDTLVPKLRELLKGNLVYDDGDRNDDDRNDNDRNGSDRNDEDIADNAAYEERMANDRVSVTGIEHIRKCIVVDQRPIGRSRTSCPATYTGIMDRVRALFAKTTQATENGYTAGLFTVNSKGGCRICKGNGMKYIHVGMGSFIELECETCDGTGFIEEALSVTLDGKNIREILAMSVSEAAVFFGRKDSQAYDRTVSGILRTLERVGMGYIALGQKTPTISGGEAQRIKLAKEISKQKGKGSVYILDEPTTGLAFADIRRLIDLMQQLSDAGNTVIITEHDPSVLSNCDYIIEMGPEGGRDGGYVIATGTPRELKENDRSVIGKYLKDAR